MPYIALYRKYRPQSFAEVSAQPHITKTLAAQVQSESASHAYLFTGTRGTGKTTCAKILAKAVNCLTPIDGSPCGTCDICLDIEAGKITDVIEMDAASNSGVDNIRDLRDNAVYLPSRCKKRVFIIDECHMLSGGAWNALLKIIEEPPAHVMFIFATTEPNKVPATIASRCQRFDFHQIGESDIAARLQTVAKAEGISLAADAANLIGRIADGALRDALSLLDTCRAADENGEITIELVANTAGLANREYLSQFAEYIIKNDAASAIALCDSLYRNSKSLDILATELAEYFRNMMVIKATKGHGNLVIATPKEQAKLTEQSGELEIQKIIEILKLLSDSLSRIGKAQNKRLEFEIFLVKAIYGGALVQAQQPAPPPVPQISNHVPPTNINVPQLTPPVPQQTPVQQPAPNGAQKQTLTYLEDTTINETADLVTITAKTKFKADFIQNKLPEVIEHFGKRITITVENASTASPKNNNMVADFLNAAKDSGTEQ